MKTVIRTSIVGPFLRPYFILTAIALEFLALSPGMRAVTPPPDGGYPGANTAEGEAPLLSLTTGRYNTAIGWLSLGSITTGQFNTGIGAGTLYRNTADQNTASGAVALFNNTTGQLNTATGAFALFSNTTGHDNTANGDNALFSNTIGVRNTAIGSGALQHNTETTDNTAVGYQALVNHIGGAETDFAKGNTAVGSQALRSDQNGWDNTAVGWKALFSNNNTNPGDPVANSNTAIGDRALYSNVIGGHNTATGAGALYSNLNAGFNTATGTAALYSNTGSFNTATGTQALCNNTSGSSNLALGVAAGDNLTTGDNNIDISNEGVAGDANTIRIGTQETQTRTFIAGIHGTVLGSGVAVRVNANGRLGTAPSSQRFKDDIKPMDKASEAMLALKPVTFRYKQELDPEHIPQFGLVAEDVEKVNPDLVVRDKEGKPYSVRYDQVNAMLLNEFLKEHKRVEELNSKAAKQDASITDLRSTVAKQEAMIGRQQKTMEAFTIQLKEQDAKLQKVSAEVEMTKRPSHVVATNP